MDRFIGIMQQIHSPLSYHPQEEFLIRGTDTLCRLRSLEDQMSLYGELNRFGFDFSKIPFKLQEWDQESGEWRMLTIDYQIQAACFLVYLCKNPDAIFIDTVHARERLKFHTKPVYRGRMLDYIEVTPFLEVTIPGNIERKEEKLLLTIDGTKISFPELKITMPAIMVAPTDEFTCFCLEELPHCNLIFKSMCGHCFHRHCIEQWFASSRGNTCPICRRIVKHIANP